MEHFELIQKCLRNEDIQWENTDVITPNELPNWIQYSLSLFNFLLRGTCLEKSYNAQDKKEDPRDKRLALDMMEDFVWEQLNTGHWKDVSPHWRKLYAHVTLLKVIYLSKQPSTVTPDLIRLCDVGLLIGDPTGATGRVLAAIATQLHQRQTQELQVEIPMDGEGDESPECQLSLRKIVGLPGKPLEIPQVCGSRTVPVEIGSKYTAEDWTQKLMTIAEFVDGYMTPPTNRPSTPQIGYVAQHTLFDQIPELRGDIRVPEYCCLGENGDVEMNAWFGPASTLTPTHFDPKHNLLAQVFGSKFVRLFPPHESWRLSPHENDSLLFNTSQVDMEDPLTLSKHPQLAQISYADVRLGPGCILYIPPRWWHMVKSLSPSFSVSFWFQ